MVNRTRVAGLTLIEVMLASALMFMLVLAFYAVAEALQRSQMTSDARIESRQAIRTAMRSFSLKGTEASYFYEGGSVVLGGYTCKLPTSTAAGDSLVVAVPRDETRPLNPADDPLSPSTALAPNGQPDGFSDNRFDIIALTTRPTTPTDTHNPGSRQIVMMRWDKQVPAAFNAPGTISLKSLGKPSRINYYDSSLKPLKEDGFRVNYGYKGTNPASATVHADFRHIPNKGPAQFESYDYIISTRNIF